MLVLLVNLPVGDLPKRFVDRLSQLEYVVPLWPYIEWIGVLGDPASAFCAAYSTLCKDFALCYALLRARTGPIELKSLDKSLIGLAMVASRTRPEEFNLAAFIPMAFSRLISQYLMNPDVEVSPQLRINLFTLKNVFDNRHLKLVLESNDARLMLNSFEIKNAGGKILRDELRTLERLLRKTPQLKKIQPRNGKQADDDGQESPNLLEFVQDCNAIWVESPEESAAGVEKVEEKNDIEKVATESEYGPTEKSNIETAATESESSAAEKSKRVLPSTTIRFVVQAIRRSRESFIISIAFPMVLVFANLINTFSSAYKQLGDEDTAQGIAYGTWYMWILILAVSSNTTASSAKTQYVADALRTAAGIWPKHIHVESVMFRNGYCNNANWLRWLTKAGVPTIHRVGILGRKDDRKFNFLWYLVWQTAGWVWIGFACANAAAVAYTTPTVGLGCRSFNHVLYASGTLLAAWFRVFKGETFEREDSSPEASPETSLDTGLEKMGTKDPSPETSPKTVPAKMGTKDIISKRAQLISGVLYHMICTFNVLVLTLGTLFQISGLYNNCKCQALFGDDNSIIDITAPTIKSRDNAARYWLSMAYVAYSTAWIACGLAICARSIIIFFLDLELGNIDAEEEEEEE